MQRTSNVLQNIYLRFVVKKYLVTALGYSITCEAT